jgi:U3 small nucleolar RNA-associated protein 13
VVGRAHDAPVHVCIVEPTSTYLASGSADGVVKVWNILGGFVTHVFKGHGGVVSALTFNCQRDASSVTSWQKMQLITASVDTRIRIFDLTTPVSASGTGAKPLAVLDGHVSVPRGLDVSADGKWLISGGRDSVVLMWDLTSKSEPKKKAHGKAPIPTLAKTIPILERVEAVGFLHPDQLLAGSGSKSDRICFYTGGENGVIKIWDAREGTVLFTLGDQRSRDSDDQEEQRQIVGAMLASIPLGSIERALTTLARQLCSIHVHDRISPCGPKYPLSLSILSNLDTTVHWV